MDSAEESKNLLKNSRLFKGFSHRVIEAIVPKLRPCSFKAREIICLKGDDSDCLHIIRKGEVEIFISSSGGKIIVLGTLSDGDVFGEIGLLDNGERTANITAKTDVDLYRLDRTDFDAVSHMFGIEEMKALTSYICLMFRRTANSLEETVFLDADIRIACKIRELYETSNTTDNSFKIAISQEDLGRRAGLSREATNKALSHLSEKGLIERQYKNIIIPDVEKFLRNLKHG